MAFKKRTSPVAETTAQRLDGLRAIEQTLDLGNGLNNSGYKGIIDEVQAALSVYNTKLSEADNARILLEQKEEELQDYARRMLAGIGVKYGFDSAEYEHAGGTRKSERRKPESRKVEG